MSGSRISRSDEYPLGVGRGGLVERITVPVERLQVRDPFHALVYREPRHGPARLLGEKGDDAALAVLLFPELGRDDRQFQRLCIDGAEIFLAGQVYQRRIRLALSVLIQLLGNPVAPEVVLAGPATRLQPRAHLQTIGLDAIQWTQQAIKAGQDA